MIRRPPRSTLSLHDALPICQSPVRVRVSGPPRAPLRDARGPRSSHRSEEHTSELQSRLHLVCRLMLEKNIFIIIQEYSPSVGPRVPQAPAVMSPMLGAPHAT